MEEKIASKSRQVYIDCLRIFACLMVIFNHTNKRGFSRYVSNVPGTLRSVLNLIPSIGCKSAVPIFLMISGALLLKKQETIGRTYRRIIKIVIDIVLFSLFYFWLKAFLKNKPFSLTETFLTMIQTNFWHLWYLYAYVAFLLSLPFLRDFVTSLQPKNMLCLYIHAVLILFLLPIVNQFVIPIHGSLILTWAVSDILIYPILGYWIANRMRFDRVKAKHILALWLINIAAFAISEICEYYFLKSNPKDKNETFLRIACIINAPVLFVTVRYWFDRISLSERWQGFIITTGACTYGIYLFHIVFLARWPFFTELWKLIEKGGGRTRWYGVYLSCACVFVISGCLTYLLQKIPGVNKLL